MTHFAYVFAAFSVSGLALAGLLGWLLIDQINQKKALEELERRGIRRRSERNGNQ